MIFSFSYGCAVTAATLYAHYPRPRRKEIQLAPEFLSTPYWKEGRSSSGGKIAVGEIDGRVGTFHGFTTGLLGPLDNVVVAGQCGERHELGRTIVHAHMRMCFRTVVRQIDDVVVAMRFGETHAA